VRRSDLISGSLILIFGLVMIFVIVPIEINSSSEYGLDPKFFPVALLWLVIAMAALLVLTRLPTAPDPADAEPLIGRRNWIFIAAVTVLLLLLFIAIEKIGFIVAGVLMIALLMFALSGRDRNWIEIAAVSLIAPVTIYYTLYHLFSVQLPAGVLFP